MKQIPDEEELFLAAIDITDPDERSEFVTTSCEGQPKLEQALRELLDFHEGNPKFLEDESVAPSPEFQPGDVVGAYQITDVLGEGGFGIVYRALQQHPIRRDVALKILKIGMDTAAVVQRFEQERQTLALLKHPQIAAVIDAGAIESGRPYFVMELVEGKPIDEFCDSLRLNIPQRLDILLQVCAAVQHAHQKGIIHRDLKPTNILVSGSDENVEPQVKVIDFGIAKAIGIPSSDVTQEGQLLGTPDYMSPEQREQAADVDIRSDVYALGALLGKLLTGQPPKFSGGNPSRHSLQDSLILPSSQVRQFGEKRLQTIALNRRETSKTLQKVVTGELDWISRKALATTPDDRYPSVAAFAADLKAFLKDQPVEAGPPTWVYIAKKFLRRNRFASLMLALVVLSVLVGTTLSTIGFLQASREWKRAETERRVAVAERDKSQATADLMQRLLDMGNVQAGHRADFTVRQMLDTFSELLDSNAANELASQPTVEADVRQTLGRSYWSLGLMDRAGPHLRHALELKRSTLGNDHIETAKCEIDYAKYLASTSQLSEAEETIRRTMPILQSSSSEQLAWAYRVQAIVDRERGDFNSSLENGRKALDLAVNVLGKDHPTSVYLKIELAPTLLEQHKLKEADAISKEALRQATRLGAETYNSGAANRNRALVLEALHDLPQATQLIRTALRIDRKVVGETSGSVVLDLIAFARMDRKRGRLRRAEEAARTACEFANDITIEPGIIQPQAYHELAEIIHDNNPEEAIEFWQKAIEAKSKSQAVHPSVGHFLVRQALCYRNLGDAREAEAKYRQCIAVMETVTVQDMKREGMRMKRRSKPASEAVIYFPLVATFNLATLLYEQDRNEELATLATDLAIRGRASGYPRCELIVDLTEAAAYLGAGNVVAAEELIDTAIAQQEFADNGRVRHAWAQVFKADVLLRQQKFDEASVLLEQLHGFAQRKKFSALRHQVERLQSQTR